MQLICFDSFFSYQKPDCFTPVAFIFLTKDKYKLLGYLLWRGDFCKLSMWTFHHFSPCFINQHVPMGCSPFRAANTRVSSPVVETWETCQQCRQMSKSVSQMLICKMCQTFFIIFFQRMWEGSNTTLFLFLFPRSGTERLYQEWQQKTGVCISFIFFSPLSFFRLFSSWLLAWYFSSLLFYFGFFILILSCLVASVQKGLSYKL